MSDGRPAQWRNGGFQPVNAGLTQIAVGHDGETWGIGDDNVTPYRWDGAAFERVNAGISKIAVGAAAYVWGIHSLPDRLAFYWGPPGPEGAFHEVNAALTKVFVGYDGEAWGIGTDGVTPYRVIGGNFQETDAGLTGGLTYMAVGSINDVWGLQQNGAVWRWNGQIQRFVAVNAGLSNISVGSDGDAWGIGMDNVTPYHWDGAAFQKVNAGLSVISVGSKDAVWGLQL
jgi:hypothetical protein